VHEAERAAAAADSRRLSNLRAATFLAAGAAMVAWDILSGAAATAALAIAGILMTVFVVQVVRHRRVRRTERWAGALAAVAHEGLLRCDRRWADLDAALPAAERAFPEPAPDHPYARDLDVTGKASLARLLGPVTSHRGRDILASWLLGPGPAGSAVRRRLAVRELAPLEELRAAYTAHGRLEGPDALRGFGVFLAWAEDEPWFLERPWLVWSARVLPVLLLVTVLADLFAGAGPWWLLPALGQVEIFRRASPAAAASFGRAELGAAPARSLLPQVRLLDTTEWADPHLRSIRTRLGEGEDAAHRHLERVVRLLDTAESRRNLFYASLAPVLLLDVHLGVALDRWRRAHGAAVRDWVDAAGEWEAVSALAVLTHDHPDWTFPAEHPQTGDRLVARALGHPLLPPERCVRNDVEVGPPGTFLLVTGSNMSGKSTLLRAIGLNAVLAAAGGPVCAAAFSAPPVRVWTSMRIDDSLAEGVSLFMAELLRIRSVVDAALAADPEGRPVLYLLDEMLHGTNTAERRVAARGIIRHLLGAGAIGAVSTHDLTLAESRALHEAASPVHFREEIASGRGPDERARITFDYRLRPGIATTRNALKLLEAVGLGALSAEPDDLPTEGAR